MGGGDHAKIFCGFDSLPDDNKTYENTAKKAWYPPFDQSESANLRTDFCHPPSLTKKFYNRVDFDFLRYKVRTKRVDLDYFRLFFVTGGGWGQKSSLFV